jgi:hypothetical protein
MLHAQQLRRCFIDRVPRLGFVRSVIEEVLTFHCGLHDVRVSGEAPGKQLGVCQLQA